MIQNQIFIKYKRREYWRTCPLCHGGIKWATDGISWFPCNEEPVLFIRDKGHEIVVKRGEMLKGSLIYRPGMNASQFRGFEYGLEPHFFTCAKIKHTKWR